MKQVFVGSILAAVVMFVWGFLYWTVLPFPYTILRSVPDEPALAAQLKQALPATGVYLLPNMKREASKEEQDEFMKRHGAGPLASIVYVAEGTNPMGPSVFLGGLLHMLVAAFVLAFAVNLAAPALATYKARFKLAAVAGLAGAIYSNLGKPIWWHQPWDFHVLNFAFDFGSWVLAAFVLAWALKPKV